MDPCAGNVNAQGACPSSAVTPTAFAANIIPAGRINPTSRALLNSWPAANVPGVVTPSGTINNFNTVANTGGNQDQVVARIDQDINSKQRLFIRFSHWNVLDLPIDPLGNGLCADRCSEKYSTNAVAAGYNYNINSRRPIFDFNANVSRFNYNRTPKNAGFDLTSIGWPASYNAAVPAIMRTPPTPCVANISDNIMCTEGQSFIQDRNTQYSLSPDLMLMRGHHQVHVWLPRSKSAMKVTPVDQCGQWGFRFLCAGAAVRVLSGFPFADFLLGYADNFSNFENHFFAQAVVPGRGPTGKPGVLGRLISMTPGG